MSFLFHVICGHFPWRLCILALKIFNRVKNSILCDFDLLWCSCIQMKLRVWFNEVLFQASRQLNYKIWKAVQTFNILCMVQMGNNAVCRVPHIRINNRPFSSGIRTDGLWYAGPALLLTLLFTPAGGLSSKLDQTYISRCWLWHTVLRVLPKQKPGS